MNARDSLWEVHYQVLVGNQGDYLRWGAHAGGRAKQSGPGVLLQEDSFTRRNLSEDANRRVVITVPVKDELLRRFHYPRNKPQALWLNISARVHTQGDAPEAMNNDVNPSWDLRSFIKDNGLVIMGLSPDQKLRWSTKEPPPWRGGKTTVSTKQSL
jgi:hypothetical protein